MKPIRNVLVVINAFNQDALDLSGRVESFLTNGGYCVSRFIFDGMSFSITCEQCDAVITLGGDGTVLFAARYAAPRHIPLFAVNLGQFGFLAAVQKNEWESKLPFFLAAPNDVVPRMMISATVVREDATVFTSPAMNDVVVSGTGTARIVRLEAFMNGNSLGGYRADGIIVATPTGSTAYSAAAGGPIIDPELEAFVLNPVCAFTLSNRPLVLPASEKLCIAVPDSQRTDVVLTVDGQESFLLQPGDRIFIEKAAFSVLLAGGSRKEFYTALKSKLSWSGGYTIQTDNGIE